MELGLPVAPPFGGNWHGDGGQVTDPAGSALASVLHKNSRNEGLIDHWWSTVKFLDLVKKLGSAG